jgi:hypothetical protein
MGHARAIPNTVIAPSLVRPLRGPSPRAAPPAEPRRPPSAPLRGASPRLRLCKGGARRSGSRGDHPGGTQRPAPQCPPSSGSGGRPRGAASRPGRAPPQRGGSQACIGPYRAPPAAFGGPRAIRDGQEKPRPSPGRPPPDPEEGGGPRRPPPLGGGQPLAQGRRSRGAHARGAGARQQSWGAAPPAGGRPPKVGALVARGVGLGHLEHKFFK